MLRRCRFQVSFRDGEECFDFIMYCSVLLIIHPACMYGHHIKQEKDRGTVANPARGQLNRENEYYFPVPVRA